VDRLVLKAMTICAPPKAQVSAGVAFTRNVLTSRRGDILIKFLKNLKKSLDALFRFSLQAFSPFNVQLPGTVRSIAARLLRPTSNSSIMRAKWNRVIQQELHSFSQNLASMPLGFFAINAVPHSQRRVNDPLPL
jgi:hypothetical protein